ncbi:N-acetyltransferase family protein [Chitinophagaceae bacterium MMS25-I14]
MQIGHCTHDDFIWILQHLTEFWDNERTQPFHHPIFLYEFGNSAFVLREDDRIIAYLFGFISQTGKTGYIHLAAVHHNYKKKGLGIAMYDHFETYARNSGCAKLKAITTPVNTASIAFHKKAGMQLLGEKNGDGIEVIKDYSGPGQDRVVFEKELN